MREETARNVAWMATLLYDQTDQPMDALLVIACEGVEGGDLVELIYEWQAVKALEKNIVQVLARFAQFVSIDNWDINDLGIWKNEHLPKFYMIRDEEHRVITVYKGEYDLGSYTNIEDALNHFSQWIFS